MLYGSASPQKVKPTASVPTEDLQIWRDEWIAAGHRSNHSKRTGELRRVLTDKLLWFLSEFSHHECGQTELEDFFAYCRDGHEEKTGRWGNAVKENIGKRAKKPMAPATIATYYVHLKGFFSWLVRRGVLEESPLKHIEKPKVPQEHIQPFSDTQIQSILAAAERSAVPSRNEALVLFLLDTGSRVSELCDLRLKDVDFSDERSLLFRVTGKGRKKRSVRLGRKASAALWKYFKAEHGIKRRFHNGPGRGQRSKVDGESPVFMSTGRSRFGEPLTPSGVLQIVKGLGESSGIGGVRCSPHTFRHTAAINFLRNGGDIFALKAMPGHESLVTVEIYLNIVQADVHEAHRKFSPVDNL